MFFDRKVQEAEVNTADRGNPDISDHDQTYKEFSPSESLGNDERTFVHGQLLPGSIALKPNRLENMQKVELSKSEGISVRTLQKFMPSLPGRRGLISFHVLPVKQKLRHSSSTSQQSSGWNKTAEGKTNITRSWRRNPATKGTGNAPWRPSGEFQRKDLPQRVFYFGRGRHYIQPRTHDTHRRKRRAVKRTETFPIKRTKRRSIHAHRTKQKEKNSPNRSRTNSGKIKIPDSASKMREESGTDRPTSTQYRHLPGRAAKQQSTKAEVPVTRTPPVSGSHASPLGTDAESDAFLGVNGEPVNMTVLRNFFWTQAREREIMQQAQWGYLSLVSLICLMLAAMWCLGARCRHRPEIKIDFQENEHLLSVKEILWRKRRYLPMCQEQDWVEVKVCDCGTNTK